MRDEVSIVKQAGWLFPVRGRWLRYLFVAMVITTIVVNLAFGMTGAIPNIDQPPLPCDFEHTQRHPSDFF